MNKDLYIVRLYDGFDNEWIGEGRRERKNERST